MVKEMMSWIGKVGEIGKDGICYKVRVLDVKESWGNTLFEVTPISGMGSKWVYSTSVNFDIMKGE